MSKVPHFIDNCKPPRSFILKGQVVQMVVNEWWKAVFASRWWLGTCSALSINIWSANSDIIFFIERSGVPLPLGPVPRSRPRETEIRSLV